MRLNKHQTETIRRIIREEAGAEASVRLFGSRLNDEAKGGDIDLLLNITRPVTNPALFSARIAARLIRALHGRHVDLVLAAPNLKTLPIHHHAMEGILL
jgi:predicted nucleotidyltransferase